MNKIILALLCSGATASADIALDFVIVGDPGNSNDTVTAGDGTGRFFGVVSEPYQIGKFEVTNANYAEFLNAVDATGGNLLGLYSASMNSDVRGGISLNAGAANGAKYELKLNMGNKPVNYVSFYDALRFANWLNNGQGGGSTEAGAYTLLGGAATPSNGLTVTRNIGATVILPSENEWYKAAYYDPVSAGADAGGTADYWLYPTQSDTAPTEATANSSGDISNPGPNVANYNFAADWNGQNGNVTTVGSAGSGSASHYGTYDQGGNLWEWTETIDPNSSRAVRGGLWSQGADYLRSSLRATSEPPNESPDLGFRVASVPEPSSALLVLGSGLILFQRRHRASVLNK